MEKNKEKMYHRIEQIKTLLIELYLKKQKTLNEIAFKLNLNVKSVSKYLKILNIPIRTKSENATILWKKISYSEKRKLSLGLIKRWKDMKTNKNPNWKDGMSKFDKRNRQSKEYTIWRLKIFERDNYTCQLCNIRGSYLEAHHKKSWVEYPHLRYDIDNGITLCKKCHNNTKVIGRSRDKNGKFTEVKQ